jgi:hypothetical protein
MLLSSVGDGGGDRVGVRARCWILPGSHLAVDREHLGSAFAVPATVSVPIVTPQLTAWAASLVRILCRPAGALPVIALVVTVAPVPSPGPRPRFRGVVSVHVTVTVAVELFTTPV